MQIGELLPEAVDNPIRLRLSGTGCGQPVYDLVQGDDTLAYGQLHAVAVHMRTELTP